MSQILHYSVFPIYNILVTSSSIQPPDYCAIAMVTILKLLHTLMFVLIYLPHNNILNQTVWNSVGDVT